MKHDFYSTRHANSQLVWLLTSRRKYSPEQTGRASGSRVLLVFSRALPRAAPIYGCKKVGARPSANKLASEVRMAAPGLLSPLSPTTCLTKSGRSPLGPGAAPRLKERAVLITLSSDKTLEADGGGRAEAAWRGKGAINLTSRLPLCQVCRLPGPAHADPALLFPEAPGERMTQQPLVSYASEPPGESGRSAKSGRKRNAFLS